jgi:SAM-dependent methyltransferase
VTSHRARTRRCKVEGQRLVYYMAAADTKFWDQHWQAYFSPEAYKGAVRGSLGLYEKPFTKYLPRYGRILEAGCGLGQNVLALRVRGYECEGVDWSSETVQLVRAIRPDLPISVSDVTQLDVPDGYYLGYISLGVVEHRREGPEPFLQEAHRVLADTGVMFVSVPYFHPLRWVKARLGLYRRPTADLAFYQYAFTAEEMTSILRRIGFTVVSTYGLDAIAGLKDDIPPLRYMCQMRGIGWLLEQRLRSWTWLDRNLGHMILFVCRKAQ